MKENEDVGETLYFLLLLPYSLWRVRHLSEETCCPDDHVTSLPKLRFYARFCCNQHYLMSLVFSYLSIYLSEISDEKHLEDTYCVTEMLLSYSKTCRCFYTLTQQPYSESGAKQNFIEDMISSS